MTEDMLLAALPGLASAFVLVLCRVGGVIMLLPGVGEAEIPMTVRAGLTLALTALLVPAIAPSVPPLPPGLDSAGLVGAELLTGLALGWLARLPSLALSMAGAVISTATGLSSVVQPDPMLGGQSSALARLLGLAAPVMLLSSGLYTLPLSALVGSYQVVPLGSVMPAGPLAQSVETALSSMLLLSIQLGGPFLLASLLLNAALGLLARLVPQLQVYSVATPGQILGGLVLLGLLASPLLSAWMAGVTASWSNLPGL